MCHEPRLAIFTRRVVEDPGDLIYSIPIFLLFSSANRVEKIQSKGESRWGGGEKCCL